MNNIEINERLANNINELFACYSNVCKIEYKKHRKYRDKIQKLQYKCFQKFENGEITKTEAKRIMSELDNIYYANINTNKFINCKLNNCKELLIEQLELLLLRLNKFDKYNDLYDTKKENYDLDDYINIKKINAIQQTNMSFK